MPVALQYRVSSVAIFLGPFKASPQGYTNCQDLSYMAHVLLNRRCSCNALLTSFLLHAFDVILIMAGGSSLSINQTQFFNNTGAQGGALAAGNGTTVDISSSVFDSNVASNGGEHCTLRPCHVGRHTAVTCLRCCTVSLRNMLVEATRWAGQPDCAAEHPRGRNVPCRQHLPQRRGLCPPVQRHGEGQHCADQRWWPLFGKQQPHWKAPACCPVSLQWL